MHPAERVWTMAQGTFRVPCIRTFVNWASFAILVIDALHMHLVSLQLSFGVLWLRSTRFPPRWHCADILPFIPLPLPLRLTNVSSIRHCVKRHYWSGLIVSVRTKRHHQIRRTVEPLERPFTSSAATHTASTISISLQAYSRKSPPNTLTN
jgi:hypothetical protein